MRGHDVTLFAVEGSTTPVRLVLEPQATASAQAIEASLAVDMADVIAEEGVPDVIFDHSLSMLAQRRLADIPAVSMCHGMARLPPWGRNWVFTSEHHGRLQGMAKPQALHLGIDIKEVPEGRPRSGRELFLLWAGRILPYKQPHVAVDMAAAACLPILLAGPIIDADYYRREVYSRLVRLDQGESGYLGALDHQALLARMGEASALLFTSDESEPAGLVMLEALAAGCPVLAFNHGANREYLADSCAKLVDGPVTATVALESRFWKSISAETCRNHVEELFSLEAMTLGAESYLEAAKMGARW